MNPIRNAVCKSVATLGLTALALSTLAAFPVSAQVPLHHIRRDQMRQAARLDRQAAHAVAKGRYREAHHLAAKAAQLRTAARHGY